MPTEVRAAIPAHVEAAILGALEKLPADRYSTAEAFAAALDDQGQTHRRQTGPGVPSTDPTERGRWLSDRRALASAIAVAVVGVVIGWGLRGTAMQEPPVEGRPSTTVEVDFGIGPDRVDSFELSPDGTMLVIEPADNRTGLWLLRLDGSEPQPIQGTEGGDDPSFSPDSRWIVYAGDDGLRRVSVGGGAAIEIDGTGAVAADPSWGFDSTIVYHALDGMFRVPWTGGEPE